MHGRALDVLITPRSSTSGGKAEAAEGPATKCGCRVVALVFDVETNRERAERVQLRRMARRMALARGYLDVWLYSATVRSTLSRYLRVVPSAAVRTSSNPPSQGAGAHGDLASLLCTIVVCRVDVD